MLGVPWKGAPARAPGILHGLLLKGHQAAFIWKAPLATLAHHMRLLAAPDYRVMWESAFDLFHPATAGLTGVLYEWRRTLAMLGWVWRDPYALQQRSGLCITSGGRTPASSSIAAVRLCGSRPFCSWMQGGQAFGA